MATHVDEPVGSAPRTNGGRRTLRVALVNMPFGSTRYPSIQLGLLQAILERRGFSAASHYLNLRFAARIGWERYEALCEQRCHLVGEWIFARAAFGEGAPEAERFLEAFDEDLTRIRDELGGGNDLLVDLREREAPAFLRECLESIPWDEYDVVGFGSVFEQNCAALGLARLIKERHPHLITVFGGANFEDEMGLEYVRALPWVDYAVIGEGDEAFPALLARLAAGDEVLDMPGVARRLPDGGVSFGGRAPMVRDLDALPEPQYRDFFDAAAALNLPGKVQNRQVQLPYETARGCWWGAKHHCTFCGLNGMGMAYRSKSPARVLAGIDELARRYNLYTFEAVDNIMDHRYIREVFVPLAEKRNDYNFFYEVKANLSHEQLGMMARGGVRRLQPGIESLSTHVLQLMRKGTTGIQNVRLLKWAAYYGMHVAWNVLFGFPGERPEDYERQLATMRLIPHLQPPDGYGRIWLERFSPYFLEAEERGIRNVRPDQAYECIYPGHVDKERIAYFFEYDAPDTLPAQTHLAMAEHVRWWQQAWKASRRPYLAYMRGAGRITVLDGRTPDAPRAHVFEERAALIYEFCGPTYHGAAQVLANLRDVHGLETDRGTVQRDLDAFTALGLMLEEDGHYLSLALPANPNW
jgi:ribosomal peptide maturation radical SAM protein 1